MSAQEERKLRTSSVGGSFEDVGGGLDGDGLDGDGSRLISDMSDVMSDGDGDDLLRIMRGFGNDFERQSRVLPNESATTDAETILANALCMQSLCLCCTLDICVSSGSL